MHRIHVALLTALVLVTVPAAAKPTETLVAKARKLSLAAVLRGPDDAHLVIERTGAPTIDLQLAGDRLHGRAGGAPFDIKLGARELSGQVGGDPLWLHVTGSDADGHIGGHDVGFVVSKTPEGHLLRGTSVGTTVRLEEGPGQLSWLPGCDRPLVRLPRTSLRHHIYQGGCADGARTRIAVPVEVAALPALQRMVVLSLLLNDRGDGRGLLSRGARQGGAR
jgi:hypothetical protein